VFSPQEFCRTCHSRSLIWTESSGIGRITTFTVVERPQTPAFDPGYIVAVVRLAEDYEMMTNIVGCAPEQVTIDALVRVRFVEVTDAATLPCFELVGG
jgi:uncharacterized OB-fold protein